MQVKNMINWAFVFVLCPVVGLSASCTVSPNDTKPCTLQTSTTRIIPEFVRIPAGINAGEDPDAGEYECKMEHDMYMDATEITVMKWRSVKEWAKTNGYEFADDEYWGLFLDESKRRNESDKLPIEGMTWYDCLKWCNARSEMDGLEPIYYVDGKTYKTGIHAPVVDVTKSGWRLPTENEWQYAARGGKIGLRFPWGNTISYKNANYTGGNGVAFRSGGPDVYDMEKHDELKKVMPVASFAPNGYGLYDMVGNAWELTQDMSDEWVAVCGGAANTGAHFLKIQHTDGRESKFPGAGFRTMRRVLDQESETVTIDQELVAKMASAINEALQQPQSKMANLARNMATFPSWNKSLKGETFSVGDYMCVWHKAPALDIDADPHRWQAGLGETKYRSRIDEIRVANLSYLHSLAIYDPEWQYGYAPIPCIVITVEKSNTSDIPYVCAFTPDGHKNFGRSEALSDDLGMLFNAFAAVSICLDNTPNKIGDLEKGFSVLRGMKGKRKSSLRFNSSHGKQSLDDRVIRERLEQLPKADAWRKVLKGTPQSSKEAKHDAYERILAIKKRLDAGESFSDVAKECSDCPSGRSGGKLGKFKRGMMVKPFEEVAFSLPVGKVSNPVRTQFGWHLILVTGKSGDGASAEVEASHILVR